MTAGEEAEGFLARWSRRKQDGPEPEPLAEAESPPPAEDLRDDDEILAELGLKHPDELLPGDDVRGFMQAAVPDRLRRMALRRLWRSNPALANLDGLVDYGDDFTDAGVGAGVVETIYRVGKGMLPDPEPEETAAEPADGTAGDAAAEDATAGTPEEAAEEPAAEGPADAPAAGDEPPPEPLAAAEIPESDFAMRNDDPPVAPPRPRRMTFR
ncbi:MAG: DUF3306 domain-containing protein [Pseudomonadota bacterium]